MSPLDEQLIHRKVKLIEEDLHFLKEQFGIFPVDYFASFLELAKQGVVSETLARDVARSTGLRNILAHEYDEIDQKQVYRAIRMALTQVPRYLQSLLASLEG